MAAEKPSSNESNWNEGDICIRKGEKCKIKKIDYSISPPSVIIISLTDGREINTEFSKLTKPPKTSNDNNDSDDKKTDKKQLTPQEIRQIRVK